MKKAKTLNKSMSGQTRHSELLEDKTTHHTPAKTMAQPLCSTSETIYSHFSMQ